MAETPRRQRFREWLNRDIELDTPTWCRPRFKPIAPGVEVKTIYGYHYIVGAFYTLWLKVRGRRG